MDESIIINNIVKLLIDNKLVDDLLDIDGIPYVAQVQLINDGIDTLKTGYNSAQLDIMPFKNILNEMYAKDT